MHIEIKKVVFFYPWWIWWIKVLSSNLKVGKICVVWHWIFFWLVWLIIKQFAFYKRTTFEFFEWHNRQTMHNKKVEVVFSDPLEKLSICFFGCGMFEMHSFSIFLIIIILTFWKLILFCNCNSKLHLKSFLVFLKEEVPIHKCKLILDWLILVLVFFFLNWLKVMHILFYNSPTIHCIDNIFLFWINFILWSISMFVHCDFSNFHKQTTLSDWRSAHIFKFELFAIFFFSINFIIIIMILSFCFM